MKGSSYVIKHKWSRYLISFIDLLGGLVIHRSQKRVLDNPQKILCIRLEQFGDVILSSFIPQCLKEKFPEAEIDFLTNSQTKALLETNPFLSHVFDWNIFWGSKERSLNYHFKKLINFRCQRYDLIVDFRADLRTIILAYLINPQAFLVGQSFRGGGFFLDKNLPYAGKIHEVERMSFILNSIGVSSDKKVFSVVPTEEDKERFQVVWDKYHLSKDQPIIILHPKAGNLLREWPLGSFKSLNQMILKKYPDLKIIVIGSSKERDSLDFLSTDFPQVLNWAGELTFRQLSLLMKKSSLFIGNESGPMHLSAVLGIPTIALFGPGLVYKFRPYGERVQVLQKIFPCHEFCDQSRCVREKTCMQEISVEDVLKMTYSFLR